jgi:hypothetical protein
MNGEFIDNVFGPLDSRFCDWFFILSVLGFVMLVVLLVSALFVGLSKRKGVEFYMQTFSIAVGYAIFYFQNRLLHTMCVSSLNK